MNKKVTKIDVSAMDSDDAENLIRKINGLPPVNDTWFINSVAVIAIVFGSVAFFGILYGAL